MGSNISLEALKAHMFETLEGVKNLNDPQASECEKVQLEQAKQIVAIADTIVDIYKTQLQALDIASKAENYTSTNKGLIEIGILEHE